MTKINKETEEYATLRRQIAKSVDKNVRDVLDNTSPYDLESLLVNGTREYRKNMEDIQVVKESLEKQKKICDECDKKLIDLKSTSNTIYDKYCNLSGIHFIKKRFLKYVC